MSHLKDLINKTYPIIILLAFVLLFFAPLLTFERTPYSGDFTGSDLLELNLPFRFLLSQSLLQGQVPLWTPLLSCGFPLLAEGQSGVFYPLNLFLYRLFSLNVALNLTVLLNFFLAGFFTYLYLRSLRVSKEGSLFSALSFAFSGFFIFRLKHLNLVNAAIWLPLGFYLIEKYFQVARPELETGRYFILPRFKKFLFGKKLLFLIFLSIIFAFQIFAGFPPIAYISIIGSFLYFTARYFSRCRPFQLRLIPGLILKLVGIWAVIGVITFGISAIQLLPTWELAQISARNIGAAYENSVLYPYPLSNLIYFLSPYFFGNPAAGTYIQDIRGLGVFWENNFYFGILALALAFLGFWHWPKKNINVKILVFLLVCSLLFGIGIYFPVFRWLWYLVPGLKQFRFPQRFLLLGLFSLAALAGFGFDWLVDWIRRLVKVRKIRVSDFYIKLFPLILILILGLDLFIYAKDYNNVIDYRAYLEEPETVKFLRAESQLSVKGSPEQFFRIYSFGWPNSWSRAYAISSGWQAETIAYIENREFLPPNVNAFYGLASIDDRAMFEGGLVGTKRFSALQYQLYASPGWGKDLGEVELPRSYARLLGLENVKYVLSFYTIKSEALELVKQIPLMSLSPVNIYKNNLVLPRIFDVYQVRQANADEEAFNILNSDNFEPSKEIILEGKIDYQSHKPTVKADIDIIKYGETEIHLEVIFPEEGFLFLSNVYYPGWQATIDNKPTKIYQANYAFSGLRVNQGEHKITFVYRPMSYEIGKWITMASICILLVYWEWHLLARYRFSRAKRRRQNNH